MAGEDFLTATERAIKDALRQLSPEERKIKSDLNKQRIAKQQIDARNARAQEYLDKTKAKVSKSPAYKAGRASAQAERAVVEGVKKVAPKVASAAKVAGRAAVPVQAAIEATRAVKLASDEDYRRETEQAYDELGDKGAIERTLEGAAGGVASIYGAAKNIFDTAKAYAGANKAIIAARNKQDELIARGILDKDGKPIPLEDRPGAKVKPEVKPEAPVKLDSMLRETDEPQESETSLSGMFSGKQFTPVGGGDEGTPAAFTEKIEPPKPTVDENRMSSLFRKATGTDFDPKSKKDKEYMSKLSSFVQSDPSRLEKSDTKIALDFYRTLK